MFGVVKVCECALRVCTETLYSCWSICAHIFVVVAAAVADYYSSYPFVLLIWLSQRQNTYTCLQRTSIREYNRFMYEWDWISSTSEMCANWNLATVYYRRQLNTYTSVVHKNQFVFGSTSSTFLKRKKRNNFRIARIF